MKKQIILDLDDVQADLFTDLRKHLNRHMGVKKLVRDFVSFDVTSVYDGLDIETFFSVLETNDVLEQLKPLKNAPEATHLMREKGYEVNVVTARSWHSEGLKASRDWLESNEFYFDRLAVSHPSESKAVAYKQFGSRFEVIVDDHIKNIDQALETGMFDHVAVINKPWNAYDERFKRGEHRYNSLWEVANKLQDVA